MNNLVNEAYYNLDAQKPTNRYLNIHGAKQINCEPENIFLISMLGVSKYFTLFVINSLVIILLIYLFTSGDLCWEFLQILSSECPKQLDDLEAE